MSPNDRKEETRLRTEIDPENVSHEAQPAHYPDVQQEQDEDLAGASRPEWEPLEQRDA